MASIVRVGEPENESEKRAVQALAEGLPAHFIVIHNFELTTGRGLPYEYDVVVVGDKLVTHVEVKGYHGRIRGDARQWVFQSGAVVPSPIPLANKKSKILKGHLIEHDRRLKDVYVDTMVLLTDERVKVELRDDQQDRVLRIDEAIAHLSEGRSPVRTLDIRELASSVSEAISGLDPNHPVTRIGLYDVDERIGQSDERTVFLARHRYIHTRPQTVLKVFHFDVYASEAEQKEKIAAIFHDQEAMRLLNAHPHIIMTGDMFAWGDNQFVLPTEYIEQGLTLEMMMEDAEAMASLGWTQKRRVIEGVSRALMHVHESGVVHRDIRPLSVVLTPDADVVKLVNFDLAKIDLERAGLATASNEGPAVQDPADLRERLDERYAAPEVWDDPASATPASDVYSLGIVFYELIVGERPYGTLSKVLKRQHVPLDKKKLTAALEAPGSSGMLKEPHKAGPILERMVAFQPADRYPHLSAVLDDLELLGEP